MKLIGALTQAGAKAAKTAPFYSAVDEALAAVKRPKGTGAEFFTELSKQPGVKKAELADRKLEQAFKAKGKMTKEEAQQVLKDNPPPNLQERVLQDLTDKERQEMLEDNMMRYGYDRYNEVPRERMRQWEEEMDAEGVKYNDPEYITKGGSNYREILLKLPQSYTEKDFHRLLMLEAEQRRGDLTPEQLKEITELQAKKQTAASNYSSGHWDDPNVLAHIRVQDRMIPQPPQKGFYVVNNTSGRQSAMFDTPEELQAYVQTLPESIRNNVTMAQGERKVPPRKILHVEEIQSDWHQEGRKKGYKNQEDYLNQKKQIQDKLNLIEPQLKAIGQSIYDFKLGNGLSMDDYRNLHKKSSELQSQRSELLDESQKLDMRTKSGIPDAPFKKNWHELAMKRLLNYAADNGYEGIAITPGSEHFRRYGSERIDWKKGDDGWIVGAKEQTGGRHEGRDIEEIARDRGILLEKQGDPVKSKEDLQRIINVVLSRGHSQDQIDKLTNRVWDRMQTEAEGTSLPRKEGMEGFYDKMLTDYLNSYGRDYGAQVEQIQAPIKYPLEGLRRMSGMAEDPPITLHNFPITPQMRESIKQKGLPLYQQIGIPTAGAGAASQMLEPEEESGLATGGVVKSAVKQAQLAKLAKMRQEMAPRAEAVKALIARDENRYLRDVVPNSLTNAEIEAEIKRMEAKAPMIMKPSALTELRKIVQQEKGDYGSRRLERAADEIPNLEKMYQEKALREAFTGDNAKALMTMNPADFEKYAAKIAEKAVSDNNFVGDKWSQSTKDYVKYLTNINRFDDVPFLLINKQESGLPLTPFIHGHEGRHRNRALASRGEQANLIQLMPRAELREPFPRRSQQEYIEALKEEMQMTGNKVKPESYFDDSLPKNLVVDRPPIDLPDFYDKGGSVKRQVKKADGGAINYNTVPDMADGERIIQGAPFKRGGKVNMTTNRDTMFLELSNKKLKRK